MGVSFNEDTVTVKDDVKKESRPGEGIDQNPSESPILFVKRAQLVTYNVTFLYLL